MEIRKTGKIENKVFKERDLIKLIKYLIRIKEEINHERSKLEIEVRFEDGTTNIGSDLFVLDETKIIKTFIANLRNYELNKIIKIDINNYINEYAVTSHHRDWVNSKFVDIKEIIDTTPNQNIWFANFRRQLFISNTFALVLSILIFITFFLKLITNLDSYTTAFFTTWILSFLIGHTISSLLLNKGLFKLYPNIEFDTTLNHLNKNRKIKSAIIAVATLVVIPLILNLISSQLF